MSVLSREALEASPLADLHEVASELGLDGFRRLRKAELIDRLLDAQSGDPKPAETDESAERERRPRRNESNGGRGGSQSRGGRGDRQPAAAVRRQEERDERRHERERGDNAPESVEGRLSITQSGSGFVKSEGGAAEIYVSAAQIRRLELKDGDRVSGPVRPPRRSERHPSLVRVESINGKSADEVAPAPPRTRGSREVAKPTLPNEKIDLVGSETLALIDRVAPIGRGSRVLLSGGPHSGKSYALRQLAVALNAVDGLVVSTVLLGVRVEEVADWSDVATKAVETLDSSPDARAKALERTLDEARRVASKGGNAVVLIDSLDELPQAAVRKALATATSKSGSLTVIAASRETVSGETTVIRFDQALAAAGRFPSIDVGQSSTLRPELLLDPRSLKALQKAHSDAVKKRRLG